MKSIVLWEVASKQKYIFSSKRLKEIKGASNIIEYVTEKEPLKIKGAEDALVYGGGGSGLYIFDSVDEGKNFIEKLSKTILKEYPGLEVVFVRVDYDKEENSIIDKIDEAYYKLGLKKRQKTNAEGHKSFGIEEKCGSTGLPANKKFKDNDTILYRSDVIVVKNKFAEKTASKFKKILGQYDTSTSTNELSDEKKSYMAIIHIDGNSMGKKIQEIKDYFKGKELSNIELFNQYTLALKTFSEKIRISYEDAFSTMNKKIVSFTKENDHLKIQAGLIPILIAGDDVTYMVNGKLGLESARIFLEELNRNPIEIINSQSTIYLNACAGVAIVKTSYPFSIGYEIAEQLNSLAKNRLRTTWKEDYSLIDWHIERGDFSGDIEKLREENYISENYEKLHLRPVSLNNANDWRSYSNFKLFMTHLNQNIQKDKLARNKLKSLRDILEQGEPETELYLESNKIEKFFKGSFDAPGKYGFYNKRCLYYDPIELMDYFIPINEGGREQ